MHKKLYFRKGRGKSASCPGKYSPGCRVFILCILLSGLVSVRVPAQQEQRVIHTNLDTVSLYTRITEARALSATEPERAAAELHGLFRECLRLGYGKGTRNALYGLIVVASENKDYPEAVRLARYMPYFADTVHNRDALGITLLQTGIALHRMAFFHQAFSAYERALHYLPAHSRQRRTIYNNIGEILLQNKQPEKALDYFDTILSGPDSPENIPLKCVAYSNKGVAYNHAGRREASIAAFDSAVSLGTEHGLWQEVHSAMVHKAGTFRDMNRPEAIITTIRDASNILELHNIASKRPSLQHIYLGDAYGMLRQYDRAEKEYMQAYNMLDTHNVGDRSYIVHELSRLYASSGNYKRGYELHMFSHAIRDSVVTREVHMRVSELEALYRSAEKDRELAIKTMQLRESERNMARKNLFLVTVSLGGMLAVTGLLVLYRHYRTGKELFRREQEITRLQGLMEGEEKERMRLSRELHDGIGGMLAALRLKAGTIRKNSQDTDQSSRLDDMIAMISDTSREVRTTAHNLLPDMLTQYSFTEALLKYIEKITGGEIRIDVHIPSPVSGLAKSTELILYRIVQELVQNALKHADATLIEIQILQHDDLLSLTVEDNGTGFDLSKERGYGLENLRYRVQGLQGSLDIDSLQGSHSTIHIAFSIEKLRHIAAQT